MIYYLHKSEIKPVYVYLAVKFDAFQCANHYLETPSRLDLMCPEGTVINITQAFYGRENNYTCGAESRWTWDCKSSSVFQLLSDHCDGREKCFFYLSNDMLGDPCGGGMKSYLRLSYQCAGLF